MRAISGLENLKRLGETVCVLLERWEVRNEPTEQDKQAEWERGRAFVLRSKMAKSHQLGV